MLHSVQGKALFNEATTEVSTSKEVQYRIRKCMTHPNSWRRRPMRVDLPASTCPRTTRCSLVRPSSSCFSSSAACSHLAFRSGSITYSESCGLQVHCPCSLLHSNDLDYPFSEPLNLPPCTDSCLSCAAASTVSLGKVQEDSVAASHLLSSLGPAFACARRLTSPFSMSCRLRSSFHHLSLGFSSA